MQRGRFARTRRTANEKEPVRLRHNLFQRVEVVFGEAQLVERDRLTGCQNPHDDVLDAAGRGDGGHPQFNIERTEFLELDFSVLRPAALGDIEVAHDLQPRGKGAAVTRRNLDVGLQ